MGHGAHDVIHFVIVALLQSDFGGVVGIGLVSGDHAVERVANAAPARQSCDGFLCKVLRSAAFFTRKNLLRGASTRLLERDHDPRDFFLRTRDLCGA